MKTFWKCFALGLLLLADASWAQSDKKAVELKMKLAQTPPATKRRFVVLDDLIWYYRNKDLKQAKHYANEALALAQKINDQPGLEVAYIRLGLIYHNQEKYDASLAYCRKSLAIAQALKHPYGIARAQNEIGIVYMLSKQYQQAIAYFNKSIAVLTEAGQAHKTGSKKANLAVCYKNLGAFDKAIENYQAAIEIYKKAKNTRQLGEAYLGLGVLYQRTRRFNLAYDYLQQALSFFEQQGNKLFLAKTYHELGLLFNNFRHYRKAIKAYQESLSLLNALGTTQNLQVTYNNLGQAYLDQGQFDEAKKWFDQSLAMARQKQDTATWALVYNNLGLIKHKTDNYREAKQYFEQSLQLSNRVTAKYNRKNVLENLSFTEARLGNYQSAFGLYRQYNEAKDSLERSFRKAMELKEAYQKQKQQNEILEKNQTIREQDLAHAQMLNYFLGVSSLLLSGLMLIGVRNYQVGKKSRKRQQKIDELLNEQETIAFSKMLEGQEQERDRIAQDLHDGLGGILAMVQSHFNALEQVPEVADVQQTHQYQTATKLLDDACEKVRNVAHEMASGMANEFKLIPALLALKKSVPQIRVEVMATGFDNKRLPAHYEAEIYLMVQEILGNVLKHAQATRLEIQLLWADGKLHIGAEDDGKGFNIQKLDKQKNTGIEGIKSRAKKLMGECTIDATEGRGTTVMIDLPI